jgi:hypothetical protein
MLIEEGSLNIKIDKDYLETVKKIMVSRHESIKPYCDSLIKIGLIKIIKKGWVFDPETYDFVFKIIPDKTLKKEPFTILAKATMVDLLKRRKVIQFIIFNKLYDDRGLF